VFRNGIIQTWAIPNYIPSKNAQMQWIVQCVPFLCSMDSPSRRRRAPTWAKDSPQSYQYSPKIVRGPNSIGEIDGDYLRQICSVRSR
jgi:hypothetical protein